MADQGPLGFGLLPTSGKALVEEAVAVVTQAVAAWRESPLRASVVQAAVGEAARGGMARIKEIRGVR